MDIAHLSMTVGTVGLAKGVVELKKFEAQAKKTDSAASKIGRTMSGMAAPLKSAAGKIGAAMAGAGRQIQNAAFQVGDFFVQVASGQSPMRALAQQLPQLLGGFGVWGAVVGAAVAATAALVPLVFSLGKGSKTLTERLEELDGILSDVDGNLRIQTMSMTQLRDMYGEAADRVRAFSDLQSQIYAVRAEDALKAQIAELGNVTSMYTSATNGGHGYRQVLMRIERQLGLTREEAKEFETLLESLSNAPTFAEQQQKLEEINHFLSANNVEASKLPPALRDAVSEAIKLSNTADELRAKTEESADVADGRLQAAMIAAQKRYAETRMEAERLAGATAAAAAAFNLTQQKLAAASKVYSGRGGDPRAIERRGTGQDMNDTFDIDKFISDFNKKEGGGGRGKSEAQKAHDDALRRSKTIIEEVRTETEKYAAEVAELEKLHESGYIDAETMAKAIEMLKDEYLKAGSAAEFFEDKVDEAKDVLLDSLVGIGSLSEGFQSLAQSIARAAFEAALFGEGPMANLFGGSGDGILGSLLGGLGIPGLANGTKNHKGGLAVVGERGKELVNLPKGTEVMPAEKTAQQMRDAAVAPAQVNLKNINILDPSLVGEFMQTEAGEEVLVNALTAAGAI